MVRVTRRVAGDPASPGTPPGAPGGAAPPRRHTAPQPRPANNSEGRRVRTAEGHTPGAQSLQAQRRNQGGQPRPGAEPALWIPSTGAPGIQAKTSHSSLTCEASAEPRVPVCRGRLYAQFHSEAPSPETLVEGAPGQHRRCKGSPTHIPAAASGTLSSLCRVLCTLRSLYLCTIGLNTGIQPYEGHTSQFELHSQRALLVQRPERMARYQADRQSQGCSTGL